MLTKTEIREIIDSWCGGKEMLDMATKEFIIDSLHVAHVKAVAKELKWSLDPNLKGTVAGNPYWLVERRINELEQENGRG